MDRFQTLTPATSTPPTHTGADAARGVEDGPSPPALPDTARREVASTGPPRCLDSREAGKHRLAVAVGLQRAGPGAVAAHWSAAVLHGLPVPRSPDIEVHLTVAAGHRPRPDGVRLHPGGPVADHHLTDADGLPATSVARTVIDVAGQAPWPHGVVLADAALHLGHVSHGDLRAVLAERACWPGARRAGAVVDLASDDATSALETLARVLLVHELALPPPLLNPWVFDATGRAIARVAMLWPQWHTVAEPAGDGTSYRPPDASYQPAHGSYQPAHGTYQPADASYQPADASYQPPDASYQPPDGTYQPPDASYQPAGGTTPFLRRYRARQLRSLGYRVVHCTWRDLTLHPDRLAERIRPLPSPWRKEVS